MNFKNKHLHKNPFCDITFHGFEFDKELAVNPIAVARMFAPLSVGVHLHLLETLRQIFRLLFEGRLEGVEIFSADHFALVVTTLATCPTWS